VLRQDVGVFKYLIWAYRYHRTCNGTNCSVGSSPTYYMCTFLLNATTSSLNTSLCGGPSHPEAVLHYPSQYIQAATLPLLYGVNPLGNSQYLTWVVLCKATVSFLVLNNA